MTFEIPDDDTPPGFDAEKAIERWKEIEEQGHPLGPARYGNTSEKADDSAERRQK